MGEKFISNENQMQELIENFLTSKLAEFFSNSIEEVPGKRQQVNVNNGEIE